MNDHDNAPRRTASQVPHHAGLPRQGVFRPIRARGRLFAGTAAAAIVGLSLGAFALAPHAPAARSHSAATMSSQTRPRMLEGGAPFSFADLVERVAPSVVTVTVEEKAQPQPQLSEQDVPAPFRNFFGNQKAQPEHAIAMGSGFIIDPSGYIVTNNHVVEDAQKITIQLKDGRKLIAKLIGTDPATDIALLKINAGKPLPAVQFANDRNVRVGDWVIAVGDPFGLSNTVTAGIVSSLGRTIGNGEYTDYIQIDAPINRGNSGGPAFDIQGKVIGMNTMIYSPSGGSVGIGFAIPSSTIHSIVAQLKAHGKVSRGWLGVEIQNFTPEMAASIGNPNLTGAIVAKVVPHSPAARAGFEQGDVVLAINGGNITDSRELTRRIANIPAGQQARFTVLRNSKKYTLTAQIALRQPQELASYTEPSATAKSTMKAMGLGLTGATPGLRRMYNLDAQTEGVVITKVDPDGDAADKGIEPGDVIVSIGNRPVRSPKDVQGAINRAKQMGRNSVLALLMTQDGERFVALGIDQKG